MPRDYAAGEEVEVGGEYLVVRAGEETEDTIKLRKGQKFPSDGAEGDAYRLKGNGQEQEKEEEPAVT